MRPTRWLPRNARSARSSATYLLTVAVGDGRRRWWAAYATAIVLTGMASLFALLLVAAHGVTLLLDRGRSHLRPWRAAVAASVAVLSPLIFLGYRQDQALGWVTLARSMRLIRRWTVQSVVLSLYAAGQP
jgi:hypothetical protein